MTALELMARFAARENAAMLARIDRVYGRDDKPTGRPPAALSLTRSQKEQIIINAVKERPGLTRPEYLAATGLNVRRWKSTVTNLAKSGRLLIVRSGPKCTYHPGPKP